MLRLYFRGNVGFENVAKRHRVIDSHLDNFALGVQ